MNGFEKGDRVELIETTKYLPPVGSRGVLVNEPTDGSGFFLHDPMVDVCFDDGETHPVYLRRLKKIDNDVPSPPVAGKGVHAQPPHVAEAGTETTKQGDHTMANPIKIETQLLIDGSPLKEFSDDSLFSIISEQEAAIKKYEAIENRPKALEAKIAAIRAGIAALVEAIDTRGPSDKPEA